MPENSLSERLIVNFEEPEKTTITQAILAAEAGSTRFAALAERWLSNNPDDEAEVSKSSLGSFALSMSGHISLDLNRLETSVYIDNNGNGVADSITSVIVHEFIHAFSNRGDLEDFLNADGVTYDYVNLRDYRGDTVKLANQIYGQLDIVAQNAYTSGENRGVLEAGFDYSNGAAINRSWVSTAIFGEDEWDSSYVGRSDDVLVSGVLDSVMSAGDGRDYLYGQRGEDSLYGGNGHDFLSGGNDEDLLYGGKGADIAMGGRGIDRVFGGEGDDLLLGTSFVARFDANEAPDELIAGRGDDVLALGRGGGILEGEGGNDLLIGSTGNDTLDGGSSADYIVTGGGVDEVRGGAGHDWINAQADGSQATVYVNAASGRDYIEIGDGGWADNGVDTIVFEGVNSEDVTLYWDYELVSSTQDVIAADQGTVLIAHQTDVFSGDAYVRIDAGGATINIGEVTFERFGLYINGAGFSFFEDNIDGYEITATYEGNTSLVFADGTLNGGSSDLMFDFVLPTQAFTEDGIAGPGRDDGFFKWEDVDQRSVRFFDNAADNFLGRFSNGYIDGAADLTVDDLDLGLLITDEAAGILI